MLDILNQLVLFLGETRFWTNTIIDSREGQLLNDGRKRYGLLPVLFEISQEDRVVECDGQPCSVAWVQVGDCEFECLVVRLSGSLHQIVAISASLFLNC